MGKKWSCPACEYKSGRWSNVSRHIGRKHGNYEVPVLAQAQHMGLNNQASRDYSYHYFPHPRQDFNNDILEKKKADSFISSYKFGINKKFHDALKLPASEEKNLIINDLLLQMERAVSSSSNQFWLGPLKEITSTKTYPSSSDSVPIWQQVIGKLLESEILNNSESIVKSDSAAKIEVSSDNHERKLQVALQKILDYKKEREIFEHRTREFGDNANTRKTDKSNPN
ncbi:MAG: hypothetical protein WBQ16_07905 [Nitrososphaeraceae archaeon]